MKTNEKADMLLPISPTISQGNGEAHGVMPGEFAGMYQAGFDAGYKSGKQAGYRQGFNESTTAVQQGVDNGAALQSAVKGKPAARNGPLRMLLGMPCVRCRVYLLSEETHCPCCKQAV